jgi:hypothetical protein
MWARSEAKFDETWFKRLIAKAIMFKALESSVPRQAWYTGGYRANIVTYAIAKVFHDVSATGRVLDLDLIWRRQAVPEPLNKALLLAALASAQVITSPPPGMHNMSEWAKKQACWAQVQALSVPYEHDLDECLVDPGEARTEVRQARGAKAVDAGIGAQMKVLEAGGPFWARVLEWARTKGQISPREAQSVEVCASYPRRVPTEPQCRQAVAVLERIKESGFKE